MFVTKYMIDGDMFCYIHERGDWVTSPDGYAKNSGDLHEPIDAYHNMSHAKFVVIVCGVLDIQLL